MVDKNPKNTHHKNQIRIIGGLWRGRKIGFPSVAGLRPTPDSVRERLFNWLGQDLTGWLVCDVFAGSGGLGFESLSRYAKRVDMCETHPLVLKNLRETAVQLQAVDKVVIHAQDGVQFLRQTGEKFDLILLDPPFVWDKWSDLWGILSAKLKPDGYVYLEAGKLPDIPPEWERVKMGKAGQSKQYLLRFCDTE